MGLRHLAVDKGWHILFRLIVREAFFQEWKRFNHARLFGMAF